MFIANMSSLSWERGINRDHKGHFIYFSTLGFLNTASCLANPYFR